MFFFFKQKTAYEMRISDWSSDVCSSDLRRHFAAPDDGKGDGAAQAAGGDQGRLGRRADREDQGNGSFGMKTLVCVEHEGGELKAATPPAATAAPQPAHAHLLAAGQDVRGLAEPAAKLPGAPKPHPTAHPPPPPP